MAAAARSCSSAMPTSNYEVVVFQDHIELQKKDNGDAVLLASKALATGLTAGSELPLQLVAQDNPDGSVVINVNLTDMSEVTGTDLNPQTNGKTIFAGGQATLQGVTIEQGATYANLVQNLIS